MHDTLYYLSGLQQTAPSLADRYHISRNAELTALTHETGIDPGFFTELITLFQTEKDLPVDNLKRFPLELITDYLLKTHAFYINTKLPEIEQSVRNLSVKIPENSVLPFLLPFFEWMSSHLIRHIRYEEEHLFPYISSLSEGLPVPGFSLSDFTENHSNEVEDHIAEIKRQIVRAQNSAEEMFPFNLLLRQLDSFEKDLRIHARIEEEVLIPLAEELEKKKRS